MVLPFSLEFDSLFKSNKHNIVFFDELVTVIKQTPKLLIRLQFHPCQRDDQRGSVISAEARR